MSQQPLRVLTFDDQGEVVRDQQQPQCLGCLERAERLEQAELAIERLTRSYEGTIANLKRELEQHLEEDVALGDVQRVFDYWADVVQDCGWWSRPPKLSTARKAAIQKRLSEGYTVEYLWVVVDSVRLARLDDDRMKQAYLDIPALLAEPTRDGRRWGMEAVYENTFEVLYAKCRRALPESEVNFLLEKLFMMRERWEAAQA